MHSHGIQRTVPAADAMGAAIGAEVAREGTRDDLRTGPVVVGLHAVELALQSCKRTTQFVPYRQVLVQRAGGLITIASRQGPSGEVGLQVTCRFSQRLGTLEQPLRSRIPYRCSSRSGS